MPTFLRVLLLDVIGAAVAVIAPDDASAAEPVARCTAVRVPTDSQDVTCVLDPTVVGRPLRFVAEFGGSHDDTKLSLVATLDGEPLTCGAGSRTDLFAEDGIVHLDCRFRVVAPAAGTIRPVLRIALTVHHAQYASSSVEAD